MLILIKIKYDIVKNCLQIFLINYSLDCSK